MDAINTWLWDNKKILVSSQNPTSLTQENQKIILEEFQKKNKSVEQTVFKLEIENYKIDKELTLEQKLNQWRTKETNVHNHTFLQKYLWNDAYVWEFLEWNWIKNEGKGEQKFNRKAVEFLWLKDKLPKNYEEFIKIRWGYNQRFIQEYFTKKDKAILTWFFSPVQPYRHFHDFGILEYCWLWDGNAIEINNEWCVEFLTPGHAGCSPHFGLSVRLCKFI